MISPGTFSIAAVRKLCLSTIRLFAFHGSSTMDSLGFQPTFVADTIFQLIVLVAWTCLNTSPSSLKNSLFDEFFKTMDDVEDLATQLSVTFAPGLFMVLKVSVPPSMLFFKNLPCELGMNWGGLCPQFRERGMSEPALYWFCNFCRHDIEDGTTNSATTIR